MRRASRWTTPLPATNLAAPPAKGVRDHFVIT